MTKRLFAALALLLAALFLFAACELKPAAPFQLGPYREGGSGGGGKALLEGSGKVETKTVSLPEETERFALEVTGISVQGLRRAEVSIVIDESLDRGLVLEADDNVIGCIDISVNNSTGRITVKTERGTVIVSPTKLQLRVGAPVEKLVVKGAWKLAYDCPSIDACEVELNGAVNADLMFNALESLRVDINGASDCTLSGTAKRADFVLNGAANINAFGLTARDASVVINGAGNCETTAESTLRAEINGVGNVTYGGGPRLERAIHGIGTVKKR